MPFRLFSSSRIASLDSHLDRYRDWGLLLLRVGVGLTYVAHGLPKLLGGPEGWAALSAYAGLTAMPTFFGFATALAETLGGLLVALGLFFRPACFFLVCVMAVALAAHLQAGDAFSAYAHPLEMGFVFAGLLIMGADRLSLGDYLFNRSRVGF